jgi:SAM-dependent methyltransferase
MAERRYSELLASIDAPQKSRSGTLEEALAIADGLERGRALDAPCGPGRMVDALARLGFQSYAADRDAKSYCGQSPFCTLDLECGLPYADSRFRFIYCGDGIEHLENPFALLRELARILEEEGVLVVVTPNYSNIERRIQFLLTGSVAKPPRRVAHYDVSRPFDRGHINPLTLPRLAYMAENAGLELVEARTLLSRKGQRWLAPLALGVRALSALNKPQRKRDLFAQHSQSWSMLMGGKQLIAVFRKGLGPPPA